MKGKIDKDHIALNRFQLKVLGLAEIVATEIGGLEDELETTDLPDRTRASGGNRGPTEINVSVPMHHTVAQAAIELWFKQSQDPVAPDYKRSATLIHQKISGSGDRSYTLSGMFPTKRTLPDLDMANEGEMAVVEWTFSVDDVIPV